MDTLRTHVHVYRTDGHQETIAYNILHEFLSFVGGPCKPSRLEMYECQ